MESCDVGVKTSVEFQATFELNITNTLPLFWHIPNIRGSWDQPGIRDPKATGYIGCGFRQRWGEGEFHQGIYPKAGALL